MLKSPGRQVCGRFRRPAGGRIRCGNMKENIRHDGGYWGKNRARQCPFDSRRVCTFMRLFIPSDGSARHYMPESFRIVRMRPDGSERTFGLARTTQIRKRATDAARKKKCSGSSFSITHRDTVALSNKHFKIRDTYLVTRRSK